MLEGAPEVEVRLRRSPQARRMSLRVSRLDGRVTLTMPSHVPLREADAFLTAKGAWLRGHLGSLRPLRPLTLGGTVPVAGQELPIVAAAGRRAGLLPDAIAVAKGRAVGPQVKGILRHQARERLVAASDRYVAQLGRSYTRITLRDTRSRWGSCSSDGALMYSWRLIMAPPEVLDYVAAHEVAHLVEMNHQPAFWAVVARLCPGYARHRDWLRSEGDLLHRISFDD